MTRFVLSRTVLAAATLASSLHAQDYVETANSYYSDIADDKRSDLVLLPLLEAMDPVPASVSTLRDAMLLPASNSTFEQARAWAEAPAQKAALEAIEEVTDEDDYRYAHAWGQPYGIDAGFEAISTGLYTELGDPPLLAAARHLYLPALDRLAILVHVEATRLASDGDPEASTELLVDFVFFARQIADREFHDEMAWGLTHIISTLERIRDVVYVDSRADAEMSGEAIREIIERLSSDRRAYLGLDRLTFPRADLLGARQVVDMVYTRNGGVKSAVFSSTLSQLATSDVPLRLFAERAKWRDAAMLQTKWDGVQNVLQRIEGDWDVRWDLDPYDTVNQQPFAYRTYRSMQRVMSASVFESVDDLSDLFELRMLANVEAVGTRHALGAIGYHNETGLFAPQIQSIRPAWISEIEADPFNADRDRGRKPPLYYFVPMRDTVDRFPSPQQVRPHDLNMIMADGPNIRVSLRDDTFVMYSTGPDSAKNWADEIQNTATAPSGRDYLIWPPVMSLQRLDLVQDGQL